MADEIRYEHKTVRAIRGTDGLMISKMRKDGWELTEQAQGTLRSTLTFRRPKKPVPWLLIGSAAAVLVVLAGVIGVASAFSDEDEAADPVSAAQSPTATATATSPPAATPPPSLIESPPPLQAITPENDPELAALLKADNCDDANRDFATRNAGRTVEFDGSIVNMGPHDDYDTRYDLLLGPGDKGPETTAGPAFKFEDVSMRDLELTGEVPATVSEGDRFRFVAEVRQFNADQCLFFLDPISTEAR